MKRILLIGGLIAALLTLAQVANAQYVQIHRDGDSFVNNIGQTLSDAELIGLVGEDIYFDTVVGARKQYNAGRKLITGGLIGMGTGYLAASLGTYLLVVNSEDRVRSRQYQPNSNYPDQYYSGSDPVDAVAGAFLTVTGYAALMSGYIALNAGIPLKIIGKSRLNWVENEFNERPAVTCQFGATPHGVGLTLQF